VKFSSASETSSRLSKKVPKPATVFEETEQIQMKIESKVREERALFKQNTRAFIRSKRLLTFR
jgi:hypothetical protein